MENDKNQSTQLLNKNPIPGYRNRILAIGWRILFRVSEEARRYTANTRLAKSNQSTSVPPMGGLVVAYMLYLQRYSVSYHAIPNIARPDRGKIGGIDGAPAGYLY